MLREDGRLDCPAHLLEVSAALNIGRKHDILFGVSVSASSNPIKFVKECKIATKWTHGTPNPTPTEFGPLRGALYF